MRPAGDWYAVQCKSGQHSRAIEHLRRQSFKVFAPYQFKTVRRGGRWVTLESLYFPGYVFVEASSCPKVIGSTRGVLRILRRAGNDFATVPGPIIAKIMDICNERGEVLPLPADEMAPGDYFVVSRGPLAGSWVKFEGLSPDGRIYALLEMSNLRAELANDTISKVRA